MNIKNEISYIRSFINLEPCIYFYPRGYFILTTGIIMVLLVIFGIFLMNGKGSFLIAGFNTMSEEEKDKYDELAVCKLMAKTVFAVVFSMVFWLLGDMYNLDWLIIIGVILFVCIILFYLISFNKSKKIRKDNL